jgi:hypothetical protein
VSFMIFTVSVQNILDTPSYPNYLHCEVPLAPILTTHSNHLNCANSIISDESRLAIDGGTHTHTHTHIKIKVKVTL